jgi:hypothetical protein
VVGPLLCCCADGTPCNGIAVAALRACVGASGLEAVEAAAPAVVGAGLPKGGVTTPAATFCFFKSMPYSTMWSSFGFSWSQSS